MAPIGIPTCRCSLDMTSPMQFLLYAGRVCLPGFAGIPLCGALERLDGASLVEMKNGVELVGQSGFEVVAEALGFGPVTDTDGGFEARLAQDPGCLVAG